MRDLYVCFKEIRTQAGVTGVPAATSLTLSTPNSWHRYSAGQPWEMLSETPFQPLLLLEACRPWAPGRDTKAVNTANTELLASSTGPAHPTGICSVRHQHYAWGLWQTMKWVINKDKISEVWHQRDHKKDIWTIWAETRRRAYSCPVSPGNSEASLPCSTSDHSRLGAKNAFLWADLPSWLNNLRIIVLVLTWQRKDFQFYFK